MTWGRVAISAATVGSSLISTFGGGGGDEPYAYSGARERLFNFGDTGKLGDYTAGERYTGSFGDFNLSDAEKKANQLLLQRLGGEGDTGLGMTALRELISTDKYNPLAAGGAYDPLRTQIDRATREASDAQKRSSAFSKNLYSTDTIQRLGDVEARGQETKASTLANLYDTYIGRKLSAIPLEENISRGRLADAYSYGGLERGLNTAKDQANYADYLRARGEQKQRLSALETLGSGGGGGGGAEQDPWMDVLSLLGQFGGSYLGSRGGRKPSVPTA